MLNDEERVWVGEADLAEIADTSHLLVQLPVHLLEDLGKSLVSILDGGVDNFLDEIVLAVLGNQAVRLAELAAATKDVDSGVDIVRVVEEYLRSLDASSSPAEVVCSSAKPSTRKLTSYSLHHSGDNVGRLVLGEGEQLAPCVGTLVGLEGLCFLAGKDVRCCQLLRPRFVAEMNSQIAASLKSLRS